MQFRWEIFNLLNRTNFDVPNRVAFTGNFGRIFSAKPPRQMQFGVKFYSDRALRIYPGSRLGRRTFVASPSQRSGTMTAQ